MQCRKNKKIWGKYEANIPTQFQDVICDTIKSLKLGKERKNSQEFPRSYLLLNQRVPRNTNFYYLFIFFKKTNNPKQSNPSNKVLSNYICNPTP